MQIVSSFPFFSSREKKQIFGEEFEGESGFFIRVLFILHFKTDIKQLKK